VGEWSEALAVETHAYPVGAAAGLLFDTAIKSARRSERAALLLIAFGELGQEFIFDE
jgi:hypothetical protein